MNVDNKLLEAALRLYAGDAVIEALERHGDKALLMPPEYRQLTVYYQAPLSLEYIDRDITREEMQNLQIHYLDSICNIVTGNGGRVLSIYGDDIISVFGLDEVSEGPESACKSAIKYFAEEKNLKDWCAEKKLPFIRSKTAIATGMVGYGNNGASNRKQFTVVGDIVNFVSKLCILCPRYQTSIIVDEKTHNAVSDKFVLSHLDDLNVKGQDDLQAIYALSANK